MSGFRTLVRAADQTAMERREAMHAVLQTMCTKSVPPEELSAHWDRLRESMDARHLRVQDVRFTDRRRKPSGVFVQKHADGWELYLDPCNATGYKGVTAVGRQFKAVAYQRAKGGVWEDSFVCGGTSYLGLFPTAVDAAVAVAQFLNGAEPGECGSPAVKDATCNQETEWACEEAAESACEEPSDTWISVHARARKLGVQLPATPELVREFGKREFGEDGEQDGWTCYYRTHENEAYKLARKHLTAYRKACEQRVRRAEVRLDANRKEESQQYDRKRKRAAYAKKCKARVARRLKDAGATVI